MRATTLIAAAFLTIVSTTEVEAQTNHHGWTMDEIRNNTQCRNHVTDMHMRLIDARNALLQRDYTLNQPNGTMHTEHVQGMQEDIKYMFRDAKAKMIRSKDFGRCKTIADRTVKRIKDYINRNAY